MAKGKPPYMALDDLQDLWTKKIKPALSTKADLEQAIADADQKYAARDALYRLAKEEDVRGLVDSYVIVIG